MERNHALANEILDGLALQPNEAETYGTLTEEEDPLFDMRAGRNEDLLKTSKFTMSKDTLIEKILEDTIPHI